MNIEINQHHTIFNPSFQTKFVNLSKEQILKLRTAGNTDAQIIKILEIGKSTYYNKLKLLGLSNDRSYENIQNSIPRDEFESMVKQKISFREICQHFNITAKMYYYLLNKFNLHNLIGANAKDIKQKDLQELADKKFSVKKICEILDISRAQYYKLMKKFNIKTSYRENSKNCSSITKEKFEELISSGKTHKQISEILNISESSVCMYIIKFKIHTQMATRKNALKDISKEKIDSLLAEGKTPDEICKILEIPRKTLTTYLHKYGIITKHKKARNNISNITKEKLQSMVDTGSTKDEICKQLNISQRTFYNLLKRLDIKYDYLHHAGEINIPKEKLDNIVNNWTSQEAIEKELGISKSTFYEKAKKAKIKTVLSDSFEILNSINPNEVQKYLDEGASSDEICKIFNITPSMYTTVMRKFNLSSKATHDLQKGKNITKELLEGMINSGKQLKQICEELNISAMTLRKKLLLFGIKKDTKNL